MSILSMSKILEGLITGKWGLKYGDRLSFIKEVYTGTNQDRRHAYSSSNETLKEVRVSVNVKQIKCNIKNERKSQLNELSQICLDREGALQTCVGNAYGGETKMSQGSHITTSVTVFSFSVSKTKFHWKKNMTVNRSHNQSRLLLVMLKWVGKKEFNNRFFFMW